MNIESNRVYYTIFGIWFITNLYKIKKQNYVLNKYKEHGVLNFVTDIV